jgi:molybdenum cofactor guanylyltransferase
MRLAPCMARMAGRPKISKVTALLTGLPGSASSGVPRTEPINSGLPGRIAIRLTSEDPAAGVPQRHRLGRRHCEACEQTLGRIGHQHQVLGRRGHGHDRPLPLIGMNVRHPPLAGAILCGGLSRRMGRDKAGILVGGSSLLDRAIERLSAVADPVILATGARRHVHDGCLSVADAAAGCGPLAGLVAALQVTPHQLCAVVAVDMPDSAPDLLRRLAALWDGEDAVVPLSPRGLEPLHAVYSRSALAGAEQALRGADLSLLGLLNRLRVRRVTAAGLIGDDAAARFAANLNRPEDVTAWRRGEAAPPPPRPR